MAEDPILAMYEQVGLGEVTPPIDYNEYKRLLNRARSMLSHDDVQQRKLAVAVAGKIGGHRGVTVVRQFLKDSEPSVRRACLSAAIENGDEGIHVLRAALGDSDDDVILETIPWLMRAADRGAASALRKLVRRDNPLVRQKATELAGHVGGPGLVILIRPLMHDKDEDVQATAREAIDRLEGLLPQNKPDPWWLADTDTTYEAPEVQALPDKLPDDIVGLIQCLARVAESDSQVVLDALAKHPPTRVSMAIRATTPNGGRDLNLGAARAARLLKRGDWVVPVRRLLPDDDPGVRMEVAHTLGEIGGGSVVIGVRSLLDAPHPQVRVAGVQALAKLCEGRELRSMLRGAMKDEDPTVQQALEKALAERG